MCSNKAVLGKGGGAFFTRASLECWCEGYDGALKGDGMIYSLALGAERESVAPHDGGYRHAPLDVYGALKTTL